MIHKILPGEQVIVPLLILTALILSACQPIQAPAVSENVEDAARHVVEFTATAEGFEGMPTLAAGWTEFTLHNEGQDPRQALVMRMDEGKTMDDVFAALQSELEGIPEWLTSVGGPAVAMPGMSSTTTINLEAGDYIMLDPVPGADGVPGAAKGYLMPLTVEASDVETVAPVADISIDLADYTFILDENEFSTGNHTVHIVNKGPGESHEAIIVQLNPEATIQDFLAAMAPDAAAGPPPGMVIAGIAALDVGEEAYLDLQLEDGTRYGLICFLPSSANEGAPHFALGMLRELNSHEATAHHHHDATAASVTGQ